MDMLGTRARRRRNGREDVIGLGELSEKVRHANSALIGLSKYTRICEWVMRRPQIQQEAVVMLADELERRIWPGRLAIVMEATHCRTHWQARQDDASVMRNTIMRSAFPPAPGCAGIFRPTRSHWKIRYGSTADGKMQVRTFRGRRSAWVPRLASPWLRRASLPSTGPPGGCHGG